MTLKYYIKFKRKLYTRNLRQLSVDVVFFFLLFILFFIACQRIFFRELRMYFKCKKNLNEIKKISDNTAVLFYINNSHTTILKSNTNDRCQRGYLV